MGQYIFTPNADVLDQDSNNTYGNKLYFNAISKDYNYAPFDGTESVATTLTSAIKEGDYIYALTRVGSESTATDSFSQRLYPLDDKEGVKVKSIKIDEVTEIAEVTLTSSIKAPVFGETGLNAAFDYFLFDREYNAINKIKIGFDRKPAQLVEAVVPLFDQDSAQPLQDESFNPLFTTEKKFFDEALKSVNATSVVVNNEESLPVSEAFPNTSEVSSSLLGIPRAEEQLSLFSDVSTLGLDESTWEYFEFNSQRNRYQNWETRDSDDGPRYTAQIIENISEQAIELSTNAVPYSYPYNESQSNFYDQTQYFRYKNFIILGNLLFLYAKTYNPGTENGYLNPAYVRWGITGGAQLGGQAEDYFQTHFFGDGISEQVAFKYIDKWTETWMSIKRDQFALTKQFINQTILGPGSINQLLKTNIYAEYKRLNEEQLNPTLDPANANNAKISIMDDQIRAHFNATGYVFQEDAGQSKGTQPGYKNSSDKQQVILQTKEVYRYQPGRISGFTFGTRVDIDPTTENNLAEWGCVNESDEYVFQLAGKNLSIIRRSTVPLTQQSLTLSGGFQENDIEFYNTYEDTKPIIGGATREKYYELKIPQSRFNGDPVNGNGLSGYDIDPENVTMWKIEFSWYGAIGVQFYAYVPVGRGEARWVKLHRIIIENSLPQANLQDPYFRMRYNLIVGDRTVTTEPQFVYKYGSSVYIDGGDLGTATVKSFLSQRKDVPEDIDEPLGTSNDLEADDDFQPMLALKSKRFIANRDGKLRPSRIITIPTSLNVSADKLVEIDLLEAEAGKGFGFTYDNGLRWNPNCSPSISEHNLLLTSGSRDSLLHGVDAPKNQGGNDLSPYAPRVFDFVFDTLGGGKKVDRISIVKQDTVKIGAATKSKSDAIPQSVELISNVDTEIDGVYVFDSSNSWWKHNSKELYFFYNSSSATWEFYFDEVPGGSDLESNGPIPEEAIGSATTEEDGFWTIGNFQSGGTNLWNSSLPYNASGHPLRLNSATYKLGRFIARPGATPRLTSSDGVGVIGRDFSINEFPRKYIKLDPTLDSPLMIDESYDDAKLNVGGLNQIYVDWPATLLDSTITKITGIDGKQKVATFRIKQLANRTSTTDYTSKEFGKKVPIDIENPLFELEASGNYFKSSKANVSFGWHRYKSLAYPRLPEYKYRGGNTVYDLLTANMSPSELSFNNYTQRGETQIGIAAEYARNFAKGERYPVQGPFHHLTTDFGDPASNYFPFRSFNNGLDVYYYVKRDVFIENDDVETGFCIPYSYAFGMTKLEKWDNAICTSDIGLSGTAIELRFLNPHAGNVPLYDHPFTGQKTYTSKFPEFRIGFTNKVPAKITMDGTTQLSGENEKWNGTFESANDDGSAGLLQDKDYIFTDYVSNKVHSSVNTGQLAYGERNYDPAQTMQDDYRIKGILNEGKNTAEIDYNIGGMPSFVKLEVAADFTLFTNITYHPEFNSGESDAFAKVYGLNYQSALISSNPNFIEQVKKDEAQPTIKFDGVDIDQIFYDNTAGSGTDTSGTKYNYDDKGLNFSNNNNYIVVRDNDGKFAEALDNDLTIKGGGLAVRHLDANGDPKDFLDTGIKFLSEPVKFYYYADESGTINEDAYYGGIPNQRVGYLIHIDGALEDWNVANAPNYNGANRINPASTNHTGQTAGTLTTTSSLLFKIVKLKFPSQPNGTELKEIQKVFSDTSTTFYPVIKLREDAQLNNINIRIEKPGEDPVVISPTWKLYGASQLIKPLCSDSPGFERLNNLDNQSTGVLSSINENFVERNRLDGVTVDTRMNKRLRQSVSNPAFVALSNDPIAYRKLPASTTVLYDVRGKKAERAKKITSYYFGNEEGESIVNEEISLKSTFGEDRNRIIPDQLGTKALFIRAQKVNLLDAETTAKVQVGVNVSEL
jgi:hypothetical protein